MNPPEKLLYETLESLTSVATREDFAAWTQDKLQSIFPHGAFIGGLGKISPEGISPWTLLSVGFPDEYLTFLQSSERQYRTPTLQRWLQTGEPQINDLTAGSEDMSEAWLAVFKASGLCNVASHGVLDSSHQFASYFSFHKIPSPLGRSHKQLLKLIVPGMHVSLLRLYQQTLTEKCLLQIESARKSLSQREQEILYWVCKGKTNYEISIILGISYKTVKNHVQSVLIKLRVNNRAQAAARAIQLRLCEPERGFSG